MEPGIIQPQRRRFQTEVFSHGDRIAYAKGRQLLWCVNLGAVNGMIHIAVLNDDTGKIQCPGCADNAVIVGSAAVEPRLYPFGIESILGHLSQLQAAEGLARRKIFTKGGGPDLRS